MKKTLRNLAILLLPTMIFISDLSAQVVSIQYRHVPQENIDEFISRETTYWSEVAKKAIDDGKMVQWALWQKVGGWQLGEGSNFMFVNVFENPEDINNMAGVWDVSKVFPNVPTSKIETNSLSTVTHHIFLQGVARVGDGTPQFVRINYAKASDLAKYLELEQSVWQPFIKGEIEGKKSTQLTWRLASLLMPSGADLPFNAVTADGYNTLSEAIAPSTAWQVEPEFPDFTALDEVHKKNRIQVYGLVKVVE